jgi:hypothetical protein
MELSLGELYKIFLATCNETYDEYVKRYNAAIDQAGNQERAHNKFLNEAQDQVKEQLNDLGNLRHQVQEAWTFDKTVTLESWIKNYIEENRCSKSEVIRIGKLFGFEYFWNDIYRLPFLGYDPNQTEALERNEMQGLDQGKLVWRTTPKVEIVDFLKLAYALHHSGILKAQSGNITDTVKELSQRLDFKLPSRWHSNLSEAFEGVNADYDHYQFLDEIRQGLSLYIAERSAKKESKSKKVDLTQVEVKD